MKKRVGFWISEGKERRLQMELFAKNYISNDLEFIKINLNCDLESQGPFDLVIHKFLDLIVCSDDTNTFFEQWTKVEAYFMSHKQVILLDPFDTIPIMISRYQQNLLTHKVVKNIKLKKRVIAPSFCRFDSNNISACMAEVDKFGLQFPILCKPEIAHGEDAHKMCIVFNKDGFKDVDTPCVGQTFINHNAKLFKIFIVGRHIYICDRPSVKNLFPGNQPTLFFNTYDVSKETSTHKLTELDEKNVEIPDIHNDLFNEIAHIYSEESGLNLYGIDLIFCMKLGKYAIIDVNCFPGYEKMPEFYNCLEQLAREKLDLLSQSSSSLSQCSHNKNKLKNSNYH